MVAYLIEKSKKRKHRNRRVIVASIALVAVLLFVLLSTNANLALFNAPDADAEDLILSEDDVQVQSDTDRLEAVAESGVNVADLSVADRSVAANREKNKAQDSAAQMGRKQRILSPSTTTSASDAYSHENGGKIVNSVPTPISDISFHPMRGFQEILNTSPVILFVRSSDKSSMEFKSLLTSEYTFSPDLIVVDLDKHSHGGAIQEYIRTNKLSTYKINYDDVSTTPDIPYLFVNGISVINKSLKDDALASHNDGTLLSKLRDLASGKVSIAKVDTPSNS